MTSTDKIIRLYVIIVQTITQSPNKAIRKTDIFRTIAPLHLLRLGRAGGQTTLALWGRLAISLNKMAGDIAARHRSPARATCGEGLARVAAGFKASRLAKIKAGAAAPAGEGGTDPAFRSPARATCGEGLARVAAGFFSLTK